MGPPPRHAPIGEMVNITYLDHLVVATADEVHPVGGHIESVDAARQRAVEVAYHRRVERLPVAELPVGPGRQQLVFQRMIADVLEQRVDTDHLTTAPRPVAYSLTNINLNSHNTEHTHAGITVNGHSSR